MIQSDNFEKLEIKDNSVYFMGKECFTLTLEKITSPYTKEINWWALGPNDVTDTLNVLNFEELLKSPREGVSTVNGLEVGNFLIWEFNDSNYLKIGQKDTKLIIELVNFMAPYPVVQDTIARLIEIERLK